MRRTPYESAAAPTSHSATDPAEFNVVCRTKPNLPNQTDSNTALLPYLTHQLGSAHEWGGVWNGPKACSINGKNHDVGLKPFLVLSGRLVICNPRKDTLFSFINKKAEE